MISPDVFFAALILLTVFAYGAYAFFTYYGLYGTASEYLICLSTALRVSDFLLSSENGLSTGRYGVVDCTKLPSAYSFLSSRGFDVSVTCGPFSEGSLSDPLVTVARRAYWKNAETPVDVAVSACSS